MPRIKSPPKYCLHRPSGQARVILNGKHVYLGKFGSTESKSAYARIVAERFSSQSPVTDLSQRHVATGLSINEVLLRYWRFAETYYVKNGKPTKELASVRESLQHLRKPYGDTLASEFGPLRLKSLQRLMIDENLSRGVINSRVGRIKRMFKWAVSEQLIPSHVFESIRTVDSLRFGRSLARKTEPVRPVEDDVVAAVLPHVSPVVAAMIQLQQLTGMRPGEVVAMRPCDITRDGDHWVYTTMEHKNLWRGHRRQVPLGPKARNLLAPFLNRANEAFLFSPCEAEALRNERRTGVSSPLRKPPIYPSELRRRSRDKLDRQAKKSKRPKRDRYDTVSYRRAIIYGIRKANRDREQDQKLPHWHPNQLRHRFATVVRKRFGIEAASVGLGHARTNVVEIYAEKNLNLAAIVAQEIG
jgi:integrase